MFIRSIMWITKKSEAKLNSNEEIELNVRFHNKKQENKQKQTIFFRTALRKVTEQCIKKQT